MEGPGTVTPAVVSEHAADADAEAVVVVEGGGEEGRGSGGGLVGIELGEGETGVVVDADMKVFPAGAGAGVAAVPGDAVTGAAKAAEFLDIKVQQVARVRVFVAADGRRRVEGTKASKPLAAEDSTDGSGRPPTVAAIWAPVQRSRRKAVMRLMRVAGMLRGERCGRELRSSNPSAPSAR